MKKKREIGISIDKDKEIDIKMQQPESHNFLDPGLAKPQPQLNLGFKNTDLG